METSDALRVPWSLDSTLLCNSGIVSLKQASYIFIFLSSANILGALRQDVLANICRT